MAIRSLLLKHRMNTTFDFTRRLRLRLALTALPLLLAGLAVARAEPWPMVDHDAAHTAYGADPFPLPLVLMWATRLPPGIHGSGLALDHGALCVLGSEEKPDNPYGGTVFLFTYDALLGRRLWSASVGAGRAGSPAIGDGDVIAAVFDGANGGFLASYSLADGKPAGRAAVGAGALRDPPAPVPSPLLDANRIWLPGAGGEVAPWDAASLAPFPPLKTGLAASGAVSIADLDLSDAGVDAIGVANDVAGQSPDGSFWSLTIEGLYPLAPVVVGPSLFLPVVGTSDTTATGLYAIDPTAGRVRWQASLATPVGIAADRDRAYVADVTGTVQAFDELAGAGRWTWRGGVVPSGMIVAGGRIMIGDAAGILHGLDSATGDEIWSFPTGLGSTGPDARFHLISAGGPEAVGDLGTLLYALREDGFLMAFRYGRYGDLNDDGTVGVDDALIALRSVVGLAPLSPSQAASADVAPSPGPGRTLGDGIIDIRDVLSILRKAVGAVAASWPFNP